MLVLASVAGSADRDEEDRLHELARGDMAHGSNATLVELAIWSEESVVASVLRRNAHLPEGALGVDGRAEAVRTLSVREVVGHVAEVDLAFVSVVLDEGVGIVGGEDDADAFLLVLANAENDRVSQRGAVVGGEFDDSVLLQCLESGLRDVGAFAVRFFARRWDDAAIVGGAVMEDEIAGVFHLLADFRRCTFDNGIQVNILHLCGMDSESAVVVEMGKLGRVTRTSDRVSDTARTRLVSEALKHL